MSNNNLKAILQAVKATLTASPSLVTASCLKEVVIGRTAEHTGFPFCRIYFGQFTNPVADTVSYERKYTVFVEIRQELTNKSKEDAELDVANALHQVLDRLSGTWQLGVSVERSEMAGDVQAVDTNAGPMLVALIRVDVTTLVQNPS